MFIFFKFSAGIFENGGYAHLLTEVKLSVFRDAVRNSCGHLHGVAQHSHKKGLGHLYDAVELMERRCKTVENTANTQLRAMGLDEDFRRLWSFPGDNPFATQRGTIPRRPSQEDVQVATNVLTKTDPEMPPQADRFPNWPKRFTKKYVDWYESRLEDGLCCAHKLFEAPMPLAQLQALIGCTLLVIPETQVGSPYYNPLFMPKEALKPMYNTGNLTQIVEVY